MYIRSAVGKGCQGSILGEAGIAGPEEYLDNTNSMPVKVCLLDRPKNDKIPK